MAGEVSVVARPSWLARLSPWTAIAVLGCATLTVVDHWRGLGPTAFPTVRGTLPNVVAVPTLAFGFLMLRFPERSPFTPTRASGQRTWFWSLWAGAIVVTVAWEFSQLWGQLVFDPLDLWGTALGAIAAAGLYVTLRPWSFLGAPTSRARPKLQTVLEDDHSHSMVAGGFEDTS